MSIAELIAYAIANRIPYAGFTVAELRGKIESPMIPPVFVSDEMVNA